MAAGGGTVCTVGAASSAHELSEACEARKESWALPRIAAPVTDLTTAGGFLFAATRDAELHMYDLKPAMSTGIVPATAPQCIDSVRLERSVRCLAASSSTIYSADGGCAIERRNWGADGLGPERLGESLGGHKRPVTALAVSNGLVYSAANDMTIRVWDELDGRPLAVLVDDVEPPTSLSVAGADVLTATSTSGGCMAMWHYSRAVMATRDWCSIPPLVVGVLRAALPSVVGRSRGDAAEAVTFGLECVHSYVQAEDPVHRAVHATGGAALSASLSGQVQVWDLTTRQLVREWSASHFGHELPLVALAMVGELICTASSDGTLRVARCPVPQPANETADDDSTPFA